MVDYFYTHYPFKYDGKPHGGYYTQEEIKEVMERIAERNGEPIVFHCAVGKDRTGVIAMLLLRLAGVSEEVVAADYSVSAENMKSILKNRRKFSNNAE